MFMQRAAAEIYSKQLLQLLCTAAVYLLLISSCGVRQVAGGCLVGYHEPYTRAHQKTTIVFDPQTQSVAESSCKKECDLQRQCVAYQISPKPPKAVCSLLLSKFNSSLVAAPTLPYTIQEPTAPLFSTWQDTKLYEVNSRFCGKGTSMRSCTTNTDTSLLCPEKPPDSGECLNRDIILFEWPSKHPDEEMTFGLNEKRITCDKKNKQALVELELNKFCATGGWIVESVVVIVKNVQKFFIDSEDVTIHSAEPTVTTKADKLIYGKQIIGKSLNLRFVAASTVKSGCDDMTFKVRLDVCCRATLDCKTDIPNTSMSPPDEKSTSSMSPPDGKDTTSKSPPDGNASTSKSPPDENGSTSKSPSDGNASTSKSPSDRNATTPSGSQCKSNKFLSSHDKSADQKLDFRKGTLADMQMLCVRKTLLCTYTRNVSDTCFPNKPSAILSTTTKHKNALGISIELSDGKQIYKADGIKPEKTIIVHNPPLKITGDFVTVMFKLSSFDNYLALFEIELCCV